jgi:hypothetical protein
VNINALTRVDHEQCFSVMQSNAGFYDVVYVEGSLSVLKIGDREHAVHYRNQLNRFKNVAKVACKLEIYYNNYFVFRS